MLENGAESTLDLGGNSFVASLVSFMLNWPYVFLMLVLAGVIAMSWLIVKLLVRAKVNPGLMAESESFIGQGAPNLETSNLEAAETRDLVNDLRQRMALVQNSNQIIRKLSGQVGDLERVLADRSARGAFGEVQMADVLKSILPAQVLKFQQTLSNGKRVDCLISLPGPPGNLCVDSKFPLDSYQDYVAADTDQARKDAATRFERHVSNHIKDIAAKYIVPGQTADQALMFLPSEAVFGCLHCDFRRVVELSHRLKVWIVSPATFAALLTTLRAVLRDSLLSRNIDQVQSEIDHLSKDLEALSQNLEAFDRHFSLLGQDLERMHKLTSTLQIRSHRIGETSVAAPTRKPPVSREIKQKSTGSDSYSGRSIPISMVQ